MEEIITEPGKVTKMQCHTCGTLMDVLHSPGVNCFAAAMGGRNRPHDIWTCPDRYEAWHRQASAIRREIDRTASKNLKDMLKIELNTILATRQPTLDKDSE